MQTPHRFRTKRQLLAYSRFGIETHDSGEHGINEFGRVLWHRVTHYTLCLFG
jgi:hypothetical protein